MSQGVSDCLRWRGEPLFKTVYEFALMPMLLHELRPATIFEIGSGTGASARWMADLCAIASVDTHVLSVDIRPVTASGRPDLTFLQGDARDPESLFPLGIRRTSHHPWLVIEDAHVNVTGIWRYFDSRLLPGDYLIVEDSRDKHPQLAAVVSDRYRVDTRYTDFFGRNATSAEDSVFAVTG